MKKIILIMFLLTIFIAGCDDNIIKNSNNTIQKTGIIFDQTGYIKTGEVEVIENNIQEISQENTGISSQNIGNPNLIKFENDLKNITTEQREYSVKSGYIYWFDKILTGVDIDSVQVIPKLAGWPPLAYIKDKNNVYCNGEKIKGINAKTFGFDEKKDVFTDKKKILNGCSIISGVNYDEYYNIHAVDGNSTEVLENTTGLKKIDKDFSRFETNGKKIYYNGIDIKGADLNSFKIIDGSFSKDNDQVFIYNNTLKNADPKSFEVVYMWDNGYDGTQFITKDNNHVFYNGNLIKGANGKSFKILTGLIDWDGSDGDVYFQDKNSIYLFEKKLINSDPKSFDFLLISGEYMGFTKDNNNLYYYGVLQGNIDPNSVIYLGYYKGDLYIKDKNKIYKNDANKEYNGDYNQLFSFKEFTGDIPIEFISVF